MHWADKIAKEVIDSKKYKPYWVDDMFTPSGYAHIGSLRGPLMHDFMNRALKDAEQKTEFTYVFNDFDTIDGLPLELSEKFSKYLGFPLRAAPSPEPGYESFAEYFTEDFKKVLADLGVTPRLLSSWDMYHEGKFDGVIKEALDNGEKIQEIYQKVSGSAKKEKGWLPFQVICEKCQKLGTTRVYEWDGKEVSYKCEPNLVTWAKGCGHEGKISPFGGTGKLPWKVDWPAHWKVMGVTIEGAGKDHASAGGSYDIAMALCKEVFDYLPPYKFAYEFFLIGGKKMASSKGLGLKARGLTGLLPASVARFLFARIDYKQAIEFNPTGTMVIPDLFDEYDRAAEAYWSGSDPDLDRTFELSQISGKPPKKMYLPRFRDVVNYLQQPGVNLAKKFAELKGSALNAEESEILKERESYSKIWLENYAPKKMKLEMSNDLSDEAKNLSGEQKKYLNSIIQLIEQEEKPEKLQQSLYECAKRLKIDTKSAFAAIYLSLIGRVSGPKAAWFLLSYPKEKVINRLREVSE